MKAEAHMHGLPQEIENWIRSQGKPFAIFFTDEQKIYFVWGNKPFEKYTEFDPSELTGLLDPKRYGFHDESEKAA